MHSEISRRVAILLFMAGLPAALITSARSDGTNANTSTTSPVAIQGYDVVSYFTDGKPIKGSSSHEMSFDDSRWRFANSSHKKMFAADPDRYLPQYGGFCAGGMAMGVQIPANPENWVIVDGKLYLVAGGKEDLDDWKSHAAENIKEADKRWAAMSGQ
jgi:hypothetical protein